MQIKKPQDIPQQFAGFAAGSYNNFKAIPKRELSRLQKSGDYKLLGQTTYAGTEARAVIRNGNILIEAVPLQGTKDDVVEEFVAHATRELQANTLPKESQEQVTLAARDSIVDATEGVLVGLTPEYVAARAALAKHSPIKVITSEKDMPKGAEPVEHFDDILPFSRKVEKAASKKIPPEAQEKFNRSVIRVFGTRATRYEFPADEAPKKKSA